VTPLTQQLIRSTCRLLAGSHFPNLHVPFVCVRGDLIGTTNAWGMLTISRFKLIAEKV
jgi:hypothetical protein